VVRRTGSAGSFSSLALRGGGAEHTAVLFGSVPLTSPDGSAFDLSTLPVWALDRVDVYRGGAPVWLGGGGASGLIHLVPRSAEHDGFELAGGVGSFGLYEGRGSGSLRRGDTGLLVAVGGTHVSGRYPYRDDGRTALRPEDDVDLVRSGAGNTDASLALHLATRIERVHVELAGIGFERLGELGALPTRRADAPTGERHRSRYVAGLTFGYRDDGRAWDSGTEPGLRAELGASASVERRALRDPFAQFGLVPRDTDDLLTRWFLRGALTGRPIAPLAITAVATYTRDGIAPSDRIAPAGPPSERDALSAAVELAADVSALGLRLQARGSGRIEAVFSRLAMLGSEEVARGEQALPSGRLGLAIAPLPWLAIQASFSTSGRLPTVLELFGDRAFLVGNPALRPEQSTGGDLGVVLSGASEPAGGVRAVSGEAELRGFVTSIRDLVAYRRNEASQLVPLNLGEALSAGLEARIAGTLFELVEASASLTVLDARDLQSGRLLPLRPPISSLCRLGIVLRPEGEVRSVRAFADLEQVSATFADPANLIALPERVRLGMGLVLDVAEHAELAVTVRDLLDARGLDLLGAPLPGRSVSLAFTLR
jgi:iron complex outermembrane receptor protein